MRYLRHIALTAAFFVPVTGCASTHKGRAVQTVVISDAIADEIADNWDVYVDRKIRECRGKNLQTAEEREACLGTAAKGSVVETTAESLILVQTSIKEALKCEELKTCPKAVDWKSLYKEAQKVFASIKDLHQEMKK